MTKNEIIKQIKAVFNTKNIPNAADLVEGNSGEAIESKNFFVNKPWTALSKPDLADNGNALGYLSASAFRYYLPAYMLLLLEDIVTADLAVDAVILQLTLPLEVDKLSLLHFIAQSGDKYTDLGEFLVKAIKDSTKSVARFIKRMDKLTLEQGKCINNFLLGIGQLHPEYFKLHEPAIASDRYWFKYTL